MGNLPLHPLLVHFPLVLAVLLPLVIVAILWGERRGLLRGRSWWVAVALAAMLSAGAFLSVGSGEAEEDRVEAVVPESALERHEKRAEVFLWATLAPLIILTGAALTRPTALRRYAGLAAVAVSLLVAGLAVRVGESGGSLVYEHNAGAAYGDQASRSMAGELLSDDDH